MSLRERKIAQTKIAIMEAVTTMLADRPLADITVREIGEAANISEMTFFNYFPAKNDVIAYFVQTWSVRVQWEMDHVLHAGGSYLQAIEALFATTAALANQKPGVMPEIVALQALDRAPLAFQPMSRAEYDRLFPSQEGIEQIEGRAIDDILREALHGAVTAGELPAASDLELVLLILVNIFFGTPVMACRDGQAPAGLYQQQLALVWRGVRAQA
jgi:AcrR family transcriptional regulator